MGGHGSEEWERGEAGEGRVERVDEGQRPVLAASGEQLKQQGEDQYEFFLDLVWRCRIMKQRRSDTAVHGTLHMGHDGTRQKKQHLRLSVEKEQQQGGNNKVETTRRQKNNSITDIRSQTCDHRHVITVNWH